MPDEEEQPYEAEVVIEETSFSFMREIIEYHNVDYAELLIPVLFDFSLLLKDAMELFQAIGQEDRSCPPRP